MYNLNVNKYKPCEYLQMNGLSVLQSKSSHAPIYAWLSATQPPLDDVLLGSLTAHLVCVSGQPSVHSYLPVFYRVKDNRESNVCLSMKDFRIYIISQDMFLFISVINHGNIHSFVLKVPDMIDNIIPPIFFKHTLIMVPKVLSYFSDFFFVFW